MKKRRGHYCRVCERVRPNERFTGRGHRDHICNECKTARRHLRRAETVEVEGSPDKHADSDGPAVGRPPIGKGRCALRARSSALRPVAEPRHRQSTRIAGVGPPLSPVGIAALALILAGLAVVALRRL